VPKVVKANSVGETCLLEEGLKGAVEHVVAAQGRVITNPDLWFMTHRYIDGRANLDESRLHRLSRRRASHKEVSTGYLPEEARRLGNALLPQPLRARIPAVIAPEGETTWRLTRERVFWDLDGGAA
jgi:hypothetical protein